MYPSDRRYSKEHEWVRVEGDVVTVGITDFAQSQLGDIVYVELPETDKACDKDDVMGTIESVKAVSEIYAPIAGTIVEVNQALDEKPEALNEEPHVSGWYCKMAIKDRAQLDDLMDAEAYAALVDSQ